MKSNLLCRCLAWSSALLLMGCAAEDVGLTEPNPPAIPDQPTPGTNTTTQDAGADGTDEPDADVQVDGGPGDDGAADAVVADAGGPPDTGPDLTDAGGGPDLGMPDVAVETGPAVDAAKDADAGVVPDAAKPDVQEAGPPDATADVADADDDHHEGGGDADDDGG